jgi:hypothetical protein
MAISYNNDSASSTATDTTIIAVSTTVHGRTLHSYCTTTYPISYGQPWDVSWSNYETVTSVSTSLDSLTNFTTTTSQASTTLYIPFSGQTFHGFAPVLLPENVDYSIDSSDSQYTQSGGAPFTYLGMLLSIPASYEGPVSDLTITSSLAPTVEDSVLFTIISSFTINEVTAGSFDNDGNLKPTKTYTLTEWSMLSTTQTTTTVGAFTTSDNFGNTNLTSFSQTDSRTTVTLNILAGQIFTASDYSAYPGLQDHKNVDREIDFYLPFNFFSNWQSGTYTNEIIISTSITTSIQKTSTSAQLTTYYASSNAVFGTGQIIYFGQYGDTFKDTYCPAAQGYPLDAPTFSGGSFTYSTKYTPPGIQFVDESGTTRAGDIGFESFENNYYSTQQIHGIYYAIASNGDAVFVPYNKTGGRIIGGFDAVDYIQSSVLPQGWDLGSYQCKGNNFTISITLMSGSLTVEAMTTFSFSTTEAGQPTTIINEKNGGFVDFTETATLTVSGLLGWTTYDGSSFSSDSSFFTKLETLSFAVKSGNIVRISPDGLVANTANYDWFLEY